MAHCKPAHCVINTAALLKHTPFLPIALAICPA